MKRIIVIILLLIAFAATAREDSLRMERTIGHDSVYFTWRNDRLHDTLAARAERRTVMRLVYNALFARHSTAESGEEKVVDQADAFRPYEGRRIARIEIIPLGLLVGSDSTWIERLGATFHVTSRHITIRRDLLFREGDELDADRLVKSQQTLQARSYLTDVAITVRPDIADPRQVVVSVFTQDNWSIGGEAIVKGSGRTSLGLFDANFLGRGIRLEVTEHFNWKSWDHGGVMIEAHQPNTFGSRFETRVVAGKRFEDSALGFSVDKPFQTATDYAGGLSLQNMAQESYLLYADDSMQIKSRQVEAWAGGSLYVPGLKSSVYLAAHFASYDFGQRPADTGPRFNPAFHDRTLTLGSAGIYRERFYTSNLIYGYGHREYLATGYRIEAVGGYSDGEFEDQWYGALSYRLGKFVGWGYLAGSIEAGTFFDRDRLGRGAVRFEGHYFSNLWQTGAHTRLRQFVTLSVLRGWNRYGGSNEVVGFLDEYALRGLSRPQRLTGTQRATLSLETVLFTAWQPLGFRMALFGFADMGLLGDEKLIVQDPFYATVGVGVRFKNERLIFNALELRLGLAVSGKGLLPAQYMSLAGQPQVPTTRFRPEAPAIISYR